MSSKQAYHSPLYLTFLFTAIILGLSTIPAKAYRIVPDSIAVEHKNGQQIVIHELEAKETYYGLSRRYRVPVKEIIAANNNKALKIGDTVRIPKGPVIEQTITVTSGGDTTTQKSIDIPVLAEGEYINYKVGKGETLSIISRRFSISVESIKRANGLTSDALKEETILKIPNKELPPPPPAASDIIVQDDDTDTVVDAAAGTEAGLDIPANKYGIREMSEKGVGVWIDDFNQESGSMLALHKTAPVGTVIKITNPMTQRTTFAKVVGKFADTAETKDAIIVISKSAASLIGVLDRRFQVEIAYGAPNESN